MYKALMKHRIARQDNPEIKPATVDGIENDMDIGIAQKQRTSAKKDYTRGTSLVMECEEIIPILEKNGNDLIDAMQIVVDKLEESPAQTALIEQCKGTLDKKIEAFFRAVKEAKESGMMPTNKTMANVSLSYMRLKKQIEGFENILKDFQKDLLEQEEKNKVNANLRATDCPYVLYGKEASTDSSQKNSNDADASVEQKSQSFNNR